MLVTYWMQTKYYSFSKHYEIMAEPSQTVITYLQYILLDETDKNIILSDTSR